MESDGEIEGYCQGNGMETSSNGCEKEDCMLKGGDVSILQYGSPVDILRLGEQGAEGIEGCDGDIEERGKYHV
jgi:hypothetical protein